MTPMTPAEREHSHRICEALGTLVCALLTWPVAYWSMESWAANDSVLNDIPNSLMLGLVVFMSYIGVFVLLDRWWTKHYAHQFTDQERVTWLMIPFAGAFFSFLNAYLAAPQTYAFPGVTQWLREVLVFSFGHGVLMACVMFCFWALGSFVSYLHRRIAPQP